MGGRRYSKAKQRVWRGIGICMTGVNVDFGDHPEVVLGIQNRGVTNREVP